ncbi:MAG: PAS domain S-box protein [Cyanobacteria bacterium J06635_1]
MTSPTFNLPSIDSERFENELSNAQTELLQTLWDSVDYGIFVLEVLQEGADFRFVCFNSAMDRISPIPMAALFNKTLTETLPPETVEYYTVHYRRAIQQGQTTHFAEKLEIENQITDWSVRVTPLRDKTDCVHQLVVTYMEVSDRTEAMSKASEQYLRTIFNNTYEAIFVHDLGGNLIDVNDRVLDLYQVSRADASRFSIADDFSSPDNPLDQLSHYWQEVVSGETLCFEWIAKRPYDGRCFEVEIVLRRVNLNGQAVVLASVRDISDRKAAEAKIEHSKQVLQQVVDSLPFAIFWKNLDSAYLGCNLEFAAIAGFEHPSQMVGKSDYDMPWKREESDWYRACDRRVMDSNKPELRIVEPQLQADGRQAWLSTSKIPLHDKAGNVNGILGVIEDITERKRIDSEQARLLAILEATTDIIGIADAQGNNLYLNKAGQTLLGIAADEVDQFHISEVHPPEILSALETEQLPLAAETGYWSGESVLLSHSGEKIPISQVMVAHRNEQGEVEFFSSIMRDIRDRKAAELRLQRQAETLKTTLKKLKQTQLQMIQSEKMSSLGQLVAGVAHEINNPVGFIHGNLQPAQQYAEDLLHLVSLYQQIYPEPEAAIAAEIEAIDLAFIQRDFPKLLDSMDMGTQRIREIVLSLRNFSRLDESERKAVDIHEGIENTLVILGSRLKGTADMPAVEIVKDYGELPPLECYPGQLNQVFMNILSNAIDSLEEKFGAEEREQGGKGAKEAEEEYGLRRGLTRTDAGTRGHGDGKNEEDSAVIQNPTITIRTELLSTNQVRIVIADNGIGMSDSIKYKMFNPFYTTKPVGKGTGMGMSISYQIITQKHGGQISCNSTLGEGAEFIINLPAEK